MSAQRSTTLKMVGKHCPRVLDHYEANAPYDRSMFAAGIAAHAVLQIVGEQVVARKVDAPGDVEAIADAVVHELVTKGRSFDGVPEPPMSVESAVAGRDLALAWLEENELRADARYEFGAAVNARWQPVHYDAPDAYYRAVFDVLEPMAVEDEESAGEGWVVRDYKSAWPTCEDELNTVQMRGQAALAAALHPDADFIRQEVVNLRTRRSWHRDIWLDDEGKALLARWRRDIDLAIAQAEHRGPDGNRPAAPGAGCVGCPYLLRCEPARAYMRDSVLDGVDRDGLALRFSVAHAFREELFALAKKACAEGEIDVHGGVVGFVPKSKREAVTDVHRVVAHAWFKVDVGGALAWDADHTDLLGLVQALKPGATAIDNVAKRLHPFTRGDTSWKEARAALEQRALATVLTPEFGVHRVTATADEKES